MTNILTSGGDKVICPSPNVCPHSRTLVKTFVFFDRFQTSNCKRQLSKQALDLHQTIFQLRQARTVDIVWIPSHCDITLHDRADQLATNANNQSTSDFSRLYQTKVDNRYCCGYGANNPRQKLK